MRKCVAYMGSPFQAELINQSINQSCFF